MSTVAAPSSVINATCQWSHYFRFWDFYRALGSVPPEALDALVAWPAPTSPEGLMVLETKTHDRVIEPEPGVGLAKPGELENFDPVDLVEDMTKNTPFVLPVATCGTHVHVLPLAALFDSSDREEANLFRDLRKRFHISAATGDYSSFLNVIRLSLRSDVIKKGTEVMGSFRNAAGTLSCAAVDDMLPTRVSDVTNLSYSAITHEIACRLAMLAKEATIEQ